MSNAPIPPSPGPSRPRPGYGGYQPSHGPSYGAGVANSGRSRGDSWRAQPSYRPRDPNADHYEPGFEDDRSHSNWGPGHSHPQGYVPSPDPWSRREIMAERMFEPSDSWKHDHVHDLDLEIPERFHEVRGRMPPPREEYMYPPYSGDPYRSETALISRRDSGYPRQADCYRPGYIEERRWNLPYTLGDSSNAWARQRSPNRLPRGQPDYRGVSYEKSLSGSPRSSRISSPRQSRAVASCRPHSPSSSSIRSSRERSKSPPRSRERSLSTARSSVDSRSYTADPPVRPPIQRSHPVGQFRGRRRGSQRFGMRFPTDGFREPVSPPFPPVLAYPNESRSDDHHFALHPSLPLRPSSPQLAPGPGGRNRFIERGFSGPTQNRHDLQGSKGNAFIPSASASQQGYQHQLARLKKKRRGGLNRKKRGLNQTGPLQETFTDTNDTPLSILTKFATPRLPSPEDESNEPKAFPTSPDEVPDPEVSTDIPVPALPQPEMEPPVTFKNESPPLMSLKSEECLPSPNLEVPVPVVADTSPPGDSGEEPGTLKTDRQETSLESEAVLELPKFVTPSEPPAAPSLEHGLPEVSMVDSSSQTQSTLFSIAPASDTTSSLPPLEPPLESCSTPQPLPVNGVPEGTTSSPTSSVAPTPSVQTPSPPRVPPEVVVAAPIAQEPGRELMPASPVSSVLQAVGVPPIVHPGRDTFSVHGKEADSLTEALRMVVCARQQLELQSRGERINPILMSNRAVATTPPDESAPLPDTLVQEVQAGQRAKDGMQAFHSHVRDALVANIAARQEATDEKITRLRTEYLSLHREWVARCAELDNSHRIDPAAGEVSALPARTTRRSAAVLGDAVRSDLEMEQIIASLGNDELYDPAHLALRNLAAIPDMISVVRGKVDAVFDDTNNLVDDPGAFYDPLPGLAEWTDDEVEIYKHRFAKYPKQFGHIAAGLPHKTQAQCVQFYYLHKKVLIDFREAIANYGQSKRRRGGRKTDKKKGGLLADIRQHDAEVSKGRNPVKPRAARKRRELARAVLSRSATAVQEEQTPVTTPTPEPELESAARPKRRRNTRPVVEAEQVGTEEPQPKRSRRAPRKPKLVADPSILDLKSLSKAVVEVPNGMPDAQSEHVAPRGRVSWSARDIDVFMRLLAQYGTDFKRIAASMPNKTKMQVNTFYTTNLDRYDLGTIATQAPGRSPTPDPPQADKKNLPEPVRDVISVNHEHSFAICDVPPISATSRSHLMDLPTCPFPIPGSSTSSTLHLYS